MPLVRIRYAPNLPTEVLSALSTDLPQAVAAAFTCDDEDGSLTADDIEVYFDTKNPWDVTPYPVLLDIEAMEFPSRVVNLKERTERLLQAVKAMLGDVKFGLWVKLVTACWTATEG